MSNFYSEEMDWIFLSRQQNKSVKATASILFYRLSKDWGRVEIKKLKTSFDLPKILIV